MAKTLERLWRDYLLDECGIINTDEERRLTSLVASLHENANALLNDEQKDAVDRYVDALCDIEAIFAQKAFIKGCEFTVSFICESHNFKR